MEEKQEENPDLNKMSRLHNHLQDIENYKKRKYCHKKKKIILEQKQPNKYFFQQEKIKQLPNWKLF